MGNLRLRGAVVHYGHTGVKGRAGARTLSGVQAASASVSFSCPSRPQYITLPSPLVPISSFPFSLDPIISQSCSGLGYQSGGIQWNGPASAQENDHLGADHLAPASVHFLTPHPSFPPSEPSPKQVAHPEKCTGLGWLLHFTNEAPKAQRSWIFPKVLQS